MWWYKLETNSGDTFYYDYGELYEARQDKTEYGGIITDRNGKKY